MIGKHAWQAQILDVIRYVFLLQHPSDLEEVTIYLSLHCHHQNDFCIKVGSDESHFNVS